MQKLVILGAGGCARDTLDVVDAINAQSPQFEVLGFLDDNAANLPDTVNDQPVLGPLDWLADHPGVSVVCGVGMPQTRYQMIRRTVAYGVTFPVLIHPQAVLTKWVSIGGGSVITAGCILTNQITIGAHVHLNVDCTIGHDVVMEDYSTLAPGVHVSGIVTIGEGAYVGVGANIIQQKTIGAWSMVGAGSAVIKDIPPNTTAVGVPAKVIKARPAGWHLEAPVPQQ